MVLRCAQNGAFVLDSNRLDSTFQKCQPYDQRERNPQRPLRSWIRCRSRDGAAAIEGEYGSGRPTLAGFSKAF